MKRPPLVAVLLALVALLLASCGDDEEESDAASTTAAAGEDAGSAPEDDVYVGTIGGVPDRHGVLVRSLEPGSPVDRSALEVGDVIVAVDDTPVATVPDLAAALSELPEIYDGGDQFELTIAQGTGEETIEVTLAANVLLGAELTDAPPGPGLRVHSLTRDGPAADAEMKPDDVVVAVDGRPVAEFDDLLQALAPHVAGDEVEIEVTRGSKELTLTATLKKRGYGQLKARPGE